MAEALHLKTKETIEGLSDEQVLDLLRLKWIAPLCASLRAMPKDIIGQLEKAVQALANNLFGAGQADTGIGGGACRYDGRSHGRRV